MSLYRENMAAALRMLEEELPHYLPADTGLQRDVVRAMAYACAAGGKRIRPVLTMEFCRICGGEPRHALPFAAAVEMIHSYSLIHDDLPCMDDSPLRRGRPSVHKAFGEATALLAGDALLTRAFEVMLDAAFRGDVSGETAAAAAAALAKGAGADGMVGGQMIDLICEGKTVDLSTLEQLQDGKTAALIVAACEMGALCGGGSTQQLTAARLYGRNVGLCFQMVDDLLDVTSDAATLGKPTGGDAAHGKSTYVSLMGTDEVRRLAAERTRQAVDALSAFGEAADELRALAWALLERKK